MMETKTIYVANLPYSATETDLTNLFSMYTEVMSARIALDRNRGWTSRGFGFVIVPADKAALVMDELEAQFWGGRKLFVCEARPQEERQ